MSETEPTQQNTGTQQEPPKELSGSQSARAKTDARLKELEEKRRQVEEEIKRIIEEQKKQEADTSQDQNETPQEATPEPSSHAEPSSPVETQPTEDAHASSGDQTSPRTSAEGKMTDQIAASLPVKEQESETPRRERERAMAISPIPQEEHEGQAVGSGKITPRRLQTTPGTARKNSITTSASPATSPLPEKDERRGSSTNLKLPPAPKGKAPTRAATLLTVKTAYPAVDEHELTLQPGDQVRFISADESGMVEGELNGKTGWFPASYVEGLPTAVTPVKAPAKSGSQTEISRNAPVTSAGAESITSDTAKKQTKSTLETFFFGKSSVKKEEPRKKASDKKDKKEEKKDDKKKDDKKDKKDDKKKEEKKEDKKEASSAPKKGKGPSLYAKESPQPVPKGIVKPGLTADYKPKSQENLAQLAPLSGVPIPKGAATARESASSTPPLTGSPIDRPASARPISTSGGSPTTPAPAQASTSEDGLSASTKPAPPTDSSLPAAHASSSLIAEAFGGLPSPAGVTMKVGKKMLKHAATARQEGLMMYMKTIRGLPVGDEAQELLAGLANIMETKKEDTKEHDVPHIEHVAETIPEPIVITPKKEVDLSQTFDTFDEEAFNKAVETFNQKPKKGVDMLIEKKLVPATPEGVAEWLLSCRELNKRMIGDYLGDPDKFNQEVLSAFIKSFDFTNVDFDIALRQCLNSFRLPGEAQKIDRIMNSFASRYFFQNKHHGIFASADAVYVLAFAVIMLNTDAHNPGVKNKMTKAQFIKTKRGINDGKDLPEDFLEDIYMRILADEIKMLEEDAGTYANTVKKGWLSMMKNGNKVAKRYWFILCDGKLFWFKKLGDKESRGDLPVSYFKFDVLEEDKKKAIPKFSFTLTQSQHTKPIRHLFSAPTEREFKGWQQKLASLCATL